MTPATSHTPTTTCQCRGPGLGCLRDPKPITHTGLLAHDGFAAHSHEVRPDHLGVKPGPLTASEHAEVRAARAARTQRTDDANLVAAEIAVHGEIVTDAGTEAAGRLAGYLIESLGFEV